MHVFNEQSAKLVRKLSQELNKDSFNLFPYVTLCTLDIVCGKSSILMLFHVGARRKTISDQNELVNLTTSLSLNPLKEMKCRW